MKLVSIFSMKEDFENLRLKYKYRKLILEGKIKLPYREAVKLIRPDSAYRLYFSLKKTETKHE